MQDKGDVLSATEQSRCLRFGRTIGSHGELRLAGQYPSDKGSQSNGIKVVASVPWGPQMNNQAAGSSLKKA
jgi:hypothetical protein